MCRIAGFVDSSLHENDLIRMRDSMYRGGPDDSGIFQNEQNQVWLAHRRLAIIDLSSAGHQPMADPSGRLHMVYNGEIYNYKEIKSELTALGRSFNTQSDSEVILQSYLQWGTDSISRFNGMFALVIYDTIKNELILARDHAGIKPLYYSVQGESLYFASEIKAFKALKPEWKKRNDWKIYFLAFGHLPEPITTLEGIQHLAKGSYLRYDLKEKKYSITKYHKPTHQYSKSSLQDLLVQVRETLDQAVQRHLISDAPIGLFLSGGIDSSLLTLLAKKYCGDQLKTLSIYFDSEKYSEKKYQDIIIKKSGAQHQSFLVTKEEFDQNLPDALAAMDQPTTDGINSYFISKYAHEYGLKAVLSGIGADELFGGYPSIKMSAWKSAFQKLPSFIRDTAALAASDKMKKISYLTGHSSTSDYLFYRGLHTISSIARILDIEEAEVKSSLSSLPSLAWNGEDRKEKAASIEYDMYMQNQLLRDSDFMSMWHALEIRVPFLDKELVALVQRIPSAWRFSDVKPKYMLTEAFREILPIEIWNRPKQGFTFPFAQWLKESEIAKPVNKTEKKYFDLFLADKLSWSKYWVIKLLQ